MQLQEVENKSYINIYIYIIMDSKTFIIDFIDKQIDDVLQTFKYKEDFVKIKRDTNGKKVSNRSLVYKLGLDNL